MEYSYKNHYKWGWDGVWDAEPGKVLQVSIGSPANGHASFREECIRIAGLLANQFTKPVMPCLSGGIDSQVVCLSFMYAGVDVEPMIMRMMVNGEQVNEHDTKGGFEFCKKHNLTPIVHDCDIVAARRRALELSYKYKFMGSVTPTVQLYATETFQHTHAMCMGGGDIAVTKKWQLKNTVYDDLYHFFDVPPMHFMKKHNIEGCLRFFMYTPELIASFMNHPVMTGFMLTYPQYFEVVPDLQTNYVFPYFVKPLLFGEQFPELLHRKKLHGFESYPQDAFPITIPKIGVRLEDLRDHLNNGKGVEKIWTSEKKEFEVPQSSLDFAKRLMSAGK